MENWNQAYSAHRFGTKSLQPGGRSEYERDWDRIVFSSAFRRLQNKTQVFPLPQEVFVHNRLTHSLEVASVGRSLAEEVGIHLAEHRTDLNLSEESVEFYRYHLKHVIASACLAHDLGNPAFGHSGEDAISQYFIDRASDASFRSLFSDAEWSDLTRFEGNANALRLLSHQFSGKLEGGFKLTYATLVSMVKYPCESSASMGKAGPKYRSKYGFFQSEAAFFGELATHMNLVREPDEKIIYRRHPFVYLVEAADDICYSIIDYEDAHRLGIFSTEKMIADFLPLILLNPNESEERILSLMEKVGDANEKIAYLRAKAINALTMRCVQQFVSNLDRLLSGDFESDLVSSDPEVKAVLKTIQRESVKSIYNHQTVVKIELAGFKIMAALLEEFIDAALCDAPRRNPRQRNTLQLMPEQYAFDENAGPYQRCMSVLDFVSGMTDLYALKLFRNLRGIEMPGLGTGS
jgi:dGTPase